MRRIVACKVNELQILSLHQGRGDTGETEVGVKLGNLLEHILLLLSLVVRLDTLRVVADIPSVKPGHIQTIEYVYFERHYFLWYIPLFTKVSK